MNKAMMIFVLMLSGCVPFHMDASISWGDGQTLEKATRIGQTAAVANQENPLTALLEELEKDQAEIVAPRLDAGIEK